MSKQKQNYLYLTGNDGLYDTTFPTSPKGDKGQRGYDGVNGIKGARGDKGSAGKAGELTQIVGSFSTNTPDNLPKNGTLPVGWDDGVNPPVPFDVEIGETLYYTTGKELWTYTPGATVSAWTLLGTAENIKGRPGDKGETGDVGPKGSAGLDGPNGLNGSEGVQGEVGDKGEVGQKGEKGYQGAAGADGATGTTGEKGNPGSDGTNGTDGTNGGKGQKGEFGEKGRRGVSGPRGLKGEEGNPGNPSWFPRLACSFNGETMEVFDANGLLSIDRIRAGEYRLNFVNVLSNDRYTVFGTSTQNNYVTIYLRDKNSVTVRVKNSSSNNLSESPYISVLVYKYAA